MAEILVVDDEVAINRLIIKNLTLVGHHCLPAYDGETAVEMIKKQKVDLVLLDIMLPKLDGHKVMQRIKGTPVIFLTARDGVMEKIMGLSEGADDYITKPFEMLELVARVEAILRRTMSKRESFQVDQVMIDFESHQILNSGKVMECTPKEYALLEALVINRNIALSREKLLDLVWGYDFDGDTRTVDVHIQKLRKKLGLEERIKTVYKMGYRLETER